MPLNRLDEKDPPAMDVNERTKERNSNKLTFFFKKNVHVFLFKTFFVSKLTNQLENQRNPLENKNIIRNYAQYFLCDKELCF